MSLLAYALAWCSALLLVASITIWAGLLRGPLLERLDGSRAANVRPAELAARALAVAVVASALAAVVMGIGWVFA